MSQQPITIDDIYALFRTSQEELREDFRISREEFDRRIAEQDRLFAESKAESDRQFPNIPQNTKRERPLLGTKPSTDLYVDYDSNKWLYPKQIVSGALDVNPDKGNCKLESDAVRTFDSIQNILK